jgi:stage II sporulation protein R
MKYKKLINILSIFIIAFIYIIHPIIENNYLINKPYNEGIIRFHVRANSDTKEDQELKLKVRDELLEVMTDKFKDSSSIDESREIIKENMDEIKSISQRVIRENKKEYDVDVFLGIDYFPVRKYGNMVFPQGEYETLLVTIGEGKGQNWWCVMFPPICFVDITHSYALETEGELDKYIIDENQPLKLKSKTVELFKKITNKEQVTDNR